VAGCLEPECLISSLKGLSDAERSELDKWVELYEHHDKYKLVGRLRPDAPEATAATAAAEMGEEMTEEEWCAGRRGSLPVGTEATWGREPAERGRRGDVDARLPNAGK